MRVLDPGHTYALANLKSDGETLLRFYKDPAIHGEGQDGTSCQETARALIDRVKRLHGEKPHPFNADILRHLRLALCLFECRALLLKAEKGREVERFSVGKDGHFFEESNK